MKKITAACLAVLMLLSFSCMAASAAPQDPIPQSQNGGIGIAPSWSYTTMISFGLNKSTGDVDVSITGNSQCTKIEGTLYLYENNGGKLTQVGYWSGLSNSSFLNIAGKASGTSASKSYYLLFQGKAWNGSNFEPLYVTENR